MILIRLVLNKKKNLYYTLYFVGPDPQSSNPKELEFRLTRAGSMNWKDPEEKETAFCSLNVTYSKFQGKV